MEPSTGFFLRSLDPLDPLNLNLWDYLNLHKKKVQTTHKIMHSCSRAKMYSIMIFPLKTKLSHTFCTSSTPLSKPPNLLPTSQPSPLGRLMGVVGGHHTTHRHSAEAKPNEALGGLGASGQRMPGCFMENLGKRKKSHLEVLRRRSRKSKDTSRTSENRVFVELLEKQQPFIVAFVFC